MTPSSDNLVTLVRGTTFSISDQDGSISPDTWQGLYHRDVRVVSRLAVTLDGAVPPLLVCQRLGASTAAHVHAAAVGPHGSPTALLLRRREVGATAIETLEIRVFDGSVRDIELCVDLASDFAALRSAGHHMGTAHATPLTPEGPDVLRGSHGEFSLTVSADGAQAATDRLAWQVDARPGRPWRATITFAPVYRPARRGSERPAGRGTVSRGADGASGAGQEPVQALQPLQVTGGAGRWDRSIASSLADLSALAVDIPERDLAYVGAGAPWFMALFGRDTLIVGLESLLAGTGTAVDGLRALARFQGAGRDGATLEQPGRIPHELRTGGAEVFGLSSGVPYYGTVDASPLFVLLLQAAHRWGAPETAVRELLPAARAAVDWCLRDGDVDGDGYVESVPDDNGLANQGWKDSGGAMMHADGTQARGPLALAEVQAYLYGALLGMADLEQRLGDPGRAPTLRAAAQRLRTAFARDFWLADRGLVAMALDGDKRPLAVASSNSGHCLLTGLLEAEAADAVVARMVGPDMATRWGIRTLGRGEQAYNPLGYHVGSVWPHDSALVVAGLMRHGATGAAYDLAAGMLEACEAFGWRLPELFAGLDADDVPFPVPYPVACSPQAWSAAAPLLLLRTVLRLQPDVPAGTVRIAPVLPDDVDLTVRGIQLGATAMDVRVRGSDVEVLRPPADLRVVVGDAT